MIGKQTTLDLNGPILDFPGTTNEIIVNPGTAATFTVGFATAFFPTQDPLNPASNTGIISYRWNAVGYGELTDGDFLGATLTGTATSTLTISNVKTPTTSGIQFFALADHIPSAYQTVPPVTAGTARSTGNAINGAKTSATNTLRVYPEIEIISQPTSRNVNFNQNATFSVNATLTDDYFLTDGTLTYQWLVNGSAVNDGTQNLGSSPQTVTTSSPVSVSRTYNSPGSESLPSSSTNISFSVAGASGGDGGSDGGINGTTRFPGGSGGSGGFASFTVPDFVLGVVLQGPKSLSFSIGTRGNPGSNVAPGGTGGGSGGSGGGGRGGNSGPLGLSGGGGGGGGSSSVSLNGSIVAVAGGGGGGGGGSFNAPFRTFQNGVSARSWNPESSISLFSGGSGFAAAVDGGGGGGGGGGSLSPQPGGFGGEDGEDGGFGGDNGESSWNPGSVTLNSTSTNSGSGYATLSYTYITSSTTTIPGVSLNLKISGSKTPILTLSSNNNITRTVQCRISHPAAVNSPILSNLVQFVALSSSDQFNLAIEEIYSTNTAGLSTFDLFASDREFLTSTSETFTNYSLYCPDRDIDIEMDLFGGKGSNNGSFSGGEGGFSRIRFTMLRNTEYVISGLTPSVNTPFIYRKGQLIACVGKGGDAGTTANGGFGGGVAIAGSNGNGRDGGLGGALVATGTLSENGILGSLTTRLPISPDTKAISPSGGRALKCTKGIYWRSQGISACTDVGITKFRLSDGTEVTNTASITRGYKSGYDIIQTAGSGTFNGGNGATGGSGGINGSGGGGGSGYTDGSITVVSSQLGGSTGNARVIIRRAV